MKLLANENIPVRSYRFLAEKGYDILHVGLENPSITDAEVIQLAINQARIILTFDRDYSILVFRDGYQPPGVMYLRLEEYSPEYPGALVHLLLESGQYSFNGQFTVVSSNYIRQRRIV